MYSRTVSYEAYYREYGIVKFRSVDVISVTECFWMFPSVIVSYHFVCGLHTQAYVTNVTGCYRVLSVNLYVVYTHRPAYYVTYVTQCYRMLSSVINVTHFVCGLHTQACIYVTYVTQCYRMLPSVINVTHYVCGLHTKACISMLPTLPSVTECYPLCMVNGTSVWAVATDLRETQVVRLIVASSLFLHFQLCILVTDYCRMSGYLIIIMSTNSFIVKLDMAESTRHIGMAFLLCEYVYGF